MSLFAPSRPRPDLLLGVYGGPSGQQHPSTKLYLRLTLDVQELGEYVSPNNNFSCLPVDTFQCLEVPPLRPRSASTDQRYRCWHLEKALNMSFNHESAVEVAPALVLAKGGEVECDWEQGTRARDWHWRAPAPSLSPKARWSSVPVSAHLLARQLIYGATGSRGVRRAFGWLTHCSPRAALKLLRGDISSSAIGDLPSRPWRCQLLEKDLLPLLEGDSREIRRGVLRWLGRWSSSSYRLPLG